MEIFLDSVMDSNDLTSKLIWHWYVGGSQLSTGHQPGQDLNWQIRRWPYIHPSER